MTEHPLDIGRTILADEDERQIPTRGQVQGLLDPSLVRRPLAKECHSDAAVPPKLMGQGVSGSHGHAPPDDAVRPQSANRCVEDVVGTGFSLVKPRPLAA